MQIKFEKNFKNVLYIKLWHFKNKSILRYLIGSIMISFGLDAFMENNNLLLLSSVTFIGLLCISLFTIFLSTFLSTRNTSTTVMNLDDECIKITESSRSEEIKVEWSEIIIIKERNDIFISSKRNRKYHYRVKIEKLNQIELQYLEDLLEKKGI